MKYRNQPELGEELGRLYARVLITAGYQNVWDAVVPVPLHPLKLKRRGYNQSAEFAKGLAQILEIQVFNCLERRKFTETQTKKSRLQRMENVDEVFALPQGISVSGLKLLLVDDVITTGATLCSCANVLWASGAKAVDLATIAAGGQ
ncbi:ComF family protein [Algoriphagus confluentis]|uniref:ComF family protein n=1 Tax=Algoriphagus confluentis TaxID=1697556 RepID=UPI0030C660BE